MADPSKKPRVTVPEVNISAWMLSVEMDQYSAVHHDGMKCVRLRRDAPDKGRVAAGGTSARAPGHEVVAVHFAARGDGVHIIFENIPEDRRSSSRLHLIMKERDMRKVTSAILAVVAFHAVNPKLGDRFRLGDEWIRKMYVKLFALAEKHGAKAFAGVAHSIVEATKLCKQSYDKAAGLDVDDAKNNARKAFSILVGHLEEEDIVTMWREAIASKVMNS